jgi:hypothetical protein
MPPHVHINFVVPPSRVWPKCNRLLRSGRSYVAPMMWVTIYERGVPERALSLNSTNYPEQGHHGDRPLLGKIPTAGPGIEPGTSCLVVRSHDHQDTRLVISLKALRINTTDTLKHWRLCKYYLKSQFRTHRKRYASPSHTKNEIFNAVWGNNICLFVQS